MIFWNLVLQARLAYSAKTGKANERKSKAALMQNLYKMEYTLLRDQWKQKFTEDHGTDLDNRHDFKRLSGKHVWKWRFESKKKEWIKPLCLKPSHF